MRDNLTTTEIWDKYQKGVDQHRTVNMYEETEKEHDFYIGEQWRKAKTGNENLPVLNIIKPVVKYQVSMIAQTAMRIVYSSMSGERAAQLCDKLTKYASYLWEKMKLDTLSWKAIKNAAITGDHYIYIFEGRIPTASVVTDKRPDLKARLIDKTNVYLADEQNSNINEQEYIIISERVPVAKVKAEAKANGLSDEDISNITSDETEDDNIGQDDSKEVKSDSGKCTSLLFLKLTSEGLEFSRSTRGVIYQPKQIVTGMDIYPIASFIWEEKKGDSRGVSTVKGMIENQIEINANAARRVIAVKRFAFPHAVIDSGKIKNPEALENVGSTITVTGLGDNPVNKYIQYLNPAPISSDAANIQNELIDRTQSLQGAGDAALGQVDPENASGEAIKAARDQAAVPLNEQMAFYKQFVEDIALIFFKLWTVYATEGLQIEYEGEQGVMSETIPQSELIGMDVGIKIDVTPIDPYSRLSQEVALERLLQAQLITFEEYVDSLSDDSSVPKAKLQQIIDKRAELAEQQQTQQIMQGMTQQIPQQIDPAILQAMGGM